MAVSKYRDSGLINDKRYIYEIRAVRERDGILWEGEGSKIEKIMSHPVSLLISRQSIEMQALF